MANYMVVLPKKAQYVLPIAPDLDQYLYSWNFRTFNNLLSGSGFLPYKNEYKLV